EMASPSGAVSSLARHALRGMVFGRVKVAAALLLVLGTMAGAYGVVSADSQDSPRPVAEQPVTKTDVPGRVAPAEAASPTVAGLRMGTTRFRHKGRVLGVAFSPKRQMLTSIGTDGAVRFWDPGTGEPATGLDPFYVEELSNSSNTAVISSEGNRLAVRGPKGELRVWDLIARRERCRWQQGDVRRDLSILMKTTLAISPDGQVLAIVDRGKTCVRLWDAASGMEWKTLGFGDNTQISYKAAIVFSYDGTFLRFSPDGSRLAICVRTPGRGCVFSVWDIAKGREAIALGESPPLLSREVDNCSPSAMAFAKDGNVLIIGGSRRLKNPVRVNNKLIMETMFFSAWDARNGSKLHDDEMDGLSEPREMILAQDGTSLISSHSDRLLVWDLGSWKYRKTIVADKENSLHIQERLICDVSLFGAVAVWNDHCAFDLVDIATGALRFPESRAHLGRIRSVTFAPGDRNIITCGDEGAVHFWNTQDGSHVRQLGIVSDDRPISTYVSPNGQVLAIVSFLGGMGRYEDRLSDDHHLTIVRFLNLSDDRTLHESSVSSRIPCVEFSPDSRKVVITGNGETHYYIRHEIRVLEIGDGRATTRAQVPSLTPPFAALKGDAGEIRSVAFSPDGGTIVSASRDLTFRFWNLATGKVTNQVAIAGYFANGMDQGGKRPRFDSAVFSRDLKTAITSGTEDDRFIVWDLVAGRAIRTIQVEKYLNVTLAVSPDGRLIASASRTSLNREIDDDSVRVWEVASGQEVCRFKTGVSGRRSLAFSRDGTMLAAGLEDTTARIWRLPAAKPPG
ncbi:WD40 repeat domain-containing protein, partial [Singulisphaera rosea]